MSGADGTWVVELEFLRGTATHSMVLEQQGERLTGRYRSRYGEQDLEGWIRGDRVEMRVGIYWQGVGAAYRFEGTCAEDRMEGRVDLGEYWSAAWRARRLP